MYGFGVVLLELLTGLAAVDTKRPTGEHSLVECTRSSLSDKKKLKKIMDPKLAQQYSLTAAFQIAQLILKCLESDPKNRPSMQEVLTTLQKAQHIKSKPKIKPKPKKHSAVHQNHTANNNYKTSQHHHHHQSPFSPHSRQPY